MKRTSFENVLAICERFIFADSNYTSTSASSQLSSGYLFSKENY
ncbi:MAG TPA: hypothetical protein VKT28_17940 [Puia sp.]|nr:hypothetical protein [Puia sp.]